MTDLDIDNTAEPGEEDITQQEISSPADDLDAVLADLGGSEDALITVSRINRLGKQEVIDRWHPADFDLLSVRDQYGGGDYVLTGRRNNRIAKGFPKRVTLAEPLKKPVINNQNDQLASIIEAGFKQQNESIKNMMLLMTQNRPSETALDPSTIRNNLLTDMKLMKELFGGGGQESSLGAEKVLDLLKTGIEFGKEAGSSETGIFDVLVKSMDTFGKPVAAALESAERLKLQQGTQQNGTVKNNTAISDKQKNDTTQSAFSNHIKFLVGQAETGGDPLLWADVVIDQVPEDELVTFLQRKDWLEVLGKLDNKVLMYREWFEALGAELKQQLNLIELDVNVSDKDESSTSTVKNNSEAGKDT